MSIRVTRDGARTDAPTWRALRRPRSATVIALAALFMAMGGTSLAGDDDQRKHSQ